MHLRDSLISLRDDPVDYGKGKDGVSVRRAHLDELKAEVDARYERKSSQYDKMKDEAKESRCRDPLRYRHSRPRSGRAGPRPR